MRDWAELAWPAARLSEALSCLGGASGYPRPAEVPPPPDPALLGHASQPALERWLEAAARRSGFEAAPTSVAYADVRRRLGEGARRRAIETHLGDTHLRRWLGVVRSLYADDVQ